MKPVNPSDVLSRFRLKRGAGLLALGLMLFPLTAQAQYYGRGYGPYVVSPYGGYDGDGRYVVPPDGGPPPPPGPYGGPYGGPPPYGPYDDVGPGGPPPGSAYGEYDPPRRSGPRPLPYDGPSGPPSAQHGGPSSSPPAQGQGGAGPVSLDMIQGRIKAAGYRLVAPPRQKGNIYLAEVEDSKSVRHRLVYDANDGHLIQNTPLGPVKKPGGPLPSEESKAPKEPERGRAGEPKANEPAADEAKAGTPPPPAPHMGEPAPPASAAPDGGK